MLKRIHITGFKALAVLLLFLLATSYVKAQQDKSIYLMPSIPQSNYSNPALIPECTYFIGMPGLSSVYVGVANNGFSFKDVIKRRADDSLYFDGQGLISSLSNKNFLNVDAQEELLSFGFRAEKNYFTLGLNTRVSSNFAFPKELMSLLINGNAQYIGKTVNIEGIELNAMSYLELSLGMAREVSSQLTVGARGKYLVGLANLSTKNADIHLGIGEKEDNYTMTARSNILINASFPVPIYTTIDSLGMVKIDSIGTFSGNPEDILSSMTNNQGFAFDLGAQYKIDNKWSVSASVLDIGSINWKENVKNFQSKDVNAAFQFSGMNFSSLFGSGSDTTAMKNLLDSLLNIFKMKESSNSYRTTLNPKVYLGAIYKLTPNDRIGFMVRNEFIPKTFRPSFTFSYNKRFGRLFSATANYTLQKDMGTNIGLGLALNLGPLQFYLINDNIYSLLDPLQAKNVNLHFGLNFVFGKRIAQVNKLDSFDYEEMMRRTY